MTEAGEFTRKELIDLGAVDPLFFSRVFFPRTFRQGSPAFHAKIYNLLESPEYQYVGIETFRGSAKTSLARGHIAKRISYGMSRTILPVSASLTSAARTVRWVKRQVETNRIWTSTFGIRKGAKWSDEEIEVISEIAGFSIYILAVGILGQVRGVNLEDYRPDFVLADDPCDEENSGTPDQRTKTAALFFGALAPGLAPRSEVPWSKMVLLQTGLARGAGTADNPHDLINMAHEDPLWHTVKFGILDEYGQSSWPERWSTDEVLQMKESYTRRGQLHIWLREYECTITSPQEAPLKIDWLRYYDTLPESMIVYFGIDPAREKSAQPHKTCISVIGAVGNKRYLLDYYAQKSVNPDEIWAEFYRLAMKWRPYLLGVETIGFQQALAWYFKKKMQELGTFWNIRPVEDHRKKRDRILQEVGNQAAVGNLYISADMHEWITEFTNWRTNVDSDLLDSTALALALTSNLVISGDEDEEFIVPALDERKYKPLELELRCP